MTMEMPKVINCDAAECAYNNDGKPPKMAPPCRRGGAARQCFFPRGKKGGRG